MFNYLLGVRDWYTSVTRVRFLLHGFIKDDASPGLQPILTLSVSSSSTGWVPSFGTGVFLTHYILPLLAGVTLCSVLAKYDPPILEIRPRLVPHVPGLRVTLRHE